MLLGNAHVKNPLRHMMHHNIHRAACGHSRRNAYNFFVLAGQLKDGLAKDRLVFGRHFTIAVLFLYLSACVFIKQPGSMKACLLFLRHIKPFAFYRYAVQEFRSGNVFEVMENFGER